MAMSVLNVTQRRAVEYVLQRSEEDSRKAFPSLLKRVKDLGYEEKDLERFDTHTRYSIARKVSKELNLTVWVGLSTAKIKCVNFIF